MNDVILGRPLSSMKESRTVPANTEQGVCISGYSGYILVNGGRLFSRGLPTCDCSGTATYSKGTSCIHVAWHLVGLMVRNGWDWAESSVAIMESDTFQGCLYFQEQGWDELRRTWDTCATSEDKPARIPKGKPKSDSFVFRQQNFYKLLDFLEASPGAGTREIRRNMPWTDNITEAYRKEAISRGYVKTSDGPRRKVCHYVASRPTQNVLTRPTPFNQSKVDRDFWSLVNQTNKTKHLSDIEREAMLESGELLDTLVGIHGYSHPVVKAAMKEARPQDYRKHYGPTDAELAMYETVQDSMGPPTYLSLDEILGNLGLE